MSPHEVARFAPLGALGRVCRLGLATRGGSALEADDVLEAVERGVNYLNWCGEPDGLSRAVRELDRRRGAGGRDAVFVAAQLEARTADAAHRELDRMLEELATGWLDVVTYYYVESEAEWAQITGPGGAAEAVLAACRDGRVRLVGLTTHQRGLAAKWTRQAGAELQRAGFADNVRGRLDLLMIRYNAAHRGAERDVLPVTRALGLPVVAFTGVRWGALLKPTPADPPGFGVPTAAECYRFVLQHPDVTVALTAPHDGRELRENLALLRDGFAMCEQRHEALRRHGDRVRASAGAFP